MPLVGGRPLGAGVWAGVLVEPIGVPTVTPELLVHLRGVPVVGTKGDRTPTVPGTGTAAYTTGPNKLVPDRMTAAVTAPVIVQTAHDSPLSIVFKLEFLLVGS